MREDGTLDVGFGYSGSTIIAFDLGQDNHDFATALALRPGSGKILVGGHVQRNSAGDTDFALLQLNGDLIFTDGFESGDTQAWSM